MGNTVMVSGFELCGSLYFYLLQLLQLLLSKNLTTMAGRVGSKPMLVVANYFASSSEDENEKEKAEVIDLQLPDFEPFYASYRRYRRELSPEELKQLINNGLININPLNTSTCFLILDPERVQTVE